MKTLEKALDDFIHYYRDRPALAKKIAPQADAETAAWTMLAHSLLNLDAMKVKR